MSDDHAVAGKCDVSALGQRSGHNVADFGAAFALPGSREVGIIGGVEGHPQDCEDLQCTRGDDLPSISSRSLSEVSVPLLPNTLLNVQRDN